MCLMKMLLDDVFDQKSEVGKNVDFFKYDTGQNNYQKTWRENVSSLDSNTLAMKVQLLQRVPSSLERRDGARQIHAACIRSWPS